MNSDLYGKRFQLPKSIIEYLQQCFDAVEDCDVNTEGYRRNKELRKSGYVTYQQLKRMKNFFDNFSGNENDLPYILNGGHYMNNWVNQTLKSLRDDVELGKKIKSVVLPNQYIDQHEKGDIRNINRPSKEHSSVIDKYNLQVTESLRRINDLIKKII